MEDDEWDRKVTKLLISEFGGRARTAQLEASLLEANLLTDGMDRVLRRLSDNSRFLIFRRGEQVKYVSVDWENVGICSEFRKKCRRENCPNFHVCKFFISCKCKKGSTCQFGHDLQDTANTKVSDSLGLSSFSPEEIRTIIFRSHPAVCVNYNKGECDDNDCPDLHVCSLFIIRQCTGTTDCRFEHSFRTSEHNQWVLDTFNLGHLTDEELRKKILVRNLNQHQSQRTRTVSSSSVSRCSTSTSKEEQDNIVDVFNFLLKRFFGRTKFNTFLTDRGNLLHGLKRPAIIEWFQDNHDRFLLYESEGDVKYVSVYNSRARACHRYHNPSRSDCGNHRCHYFHVCRRYVGGDCVSPRCSLTHDLSSGSNVKVRSDLNLDQLTDDEVLALILCSSPAVCVNHNKSGCKLSDCPDLHVCLTYIFNQCPRGEGCKSGHAIRDSGEHNSYVLKAFGLDELPEDELRRLVIVKKGNNREDPQDAGVLAVQTTPPRGQEVATVLSVHQAAPDVYQTAASGVAERQIEIDFIDYILDPSNWSRVEADEDVDTYEYICETYTWTGACPKGSDCPRYHSPHRRPYLWLKLEDGHPPSVSVVFEERFCAVDDIFVNKFSVNFGTKSFTVERMGTNQSIEVRRLSTPSYVDAAPGTPLNFYTQWVWYRKEYDGRYVEFYPGSLQYTLEEKYLKGQHKYYFEFEGNHLMVDTHSSPMTQTNLHTQLGTPVCRRPVFVSHEMSVQPAMSPLLFSVVPDIIHQTPEHWIAVDRFQTFELIELDCDDPKYVDVRRQFFSTMNEEKHQVVHIFRVQNPALWDKYCSARRAMTPHGESPEDVKERLLFHGTPTLQAARGICANSFDFRRSGENVGAIHGKGAYFSTTAEYSHSYTADQMEASGHHMRYMFLGRVLVGQHTLGHPSYKMPPERKDRKKYDSCVNNVDEPTIFVIFDLAQSYPEYFIKYTDAPQSKQCKRYPAFSLAGSSCTCKPVGSSSICTSTSRSVGSPSTSKSVGSLSSVTPSGFPSTSTSTGSPSSAGSTPTSKSVGSPCTPTSAVSPSTSKPLRPPSSISTAASTSKFIGSASTPQTLGCNSTPSCKESCYASTIAESFSSFKSVASPATATSATTGLPSTSAGSTSTKSSSISPSAGSSVPSVAGSPSTLRCVGTPSTSGSTFASTSTHSKPASNRLTSSAPKHTPSHSMQPVTQSAHMPSSAAQPLPASHPAPQPPTSAMTPSVSPSTNSPSALSARREQSLSPSSSSSSSCSSSSSSSSSSPNMSTSDYLPLSDSISELFDTATIFAIIITIVAIIIFVSPHRP